MQRGRNKRKKQEKLDKQKAGIQAKVSQQLYTNNNRVP